MGITNEYSLRLQGEKVRQPRNHYMREAEENWVQIREICSFRGTERIVTLHPPVDDLIWPKHVEPLGTCSQHKEIN